MSSESRVGAALSLIICDVDLRVTETHLQRELWHLCAHLSGLRSYSILVSALIVLMRSAFGYVIVSAWILSPSFLIARNGRDFDHAYRFECIRGRARVRYSISTF